MKKTYLVPALEEQKLNTELIIAGSITKVSGDAADIEKGDEMEDAAALIKQLMPFSF